MCRSLLVFGLWVMAKIVPSAGQVYVIPAPRGQTGCSEVTYLDKICDVSTCCNLPSGCFELGVRSVVTTNFPGPEFDAYKEEGCIVDAYYLEAPFCYTCGDGTSVHIGNDVPTPSPTFSPTSSPTATPTASPTAPPPSEPPYTKTILVCVGIGAAFIISVAACAWYLHRWRKLPEEQPLIPAAAVV